MLFIILLFLIIAYLKEKIRNNEHNLRLARLEWELIERQQMITQIKQLEKQIELSEKELATKKSKLESLHPKLNQILDASKSALDYFNEKFTDETSIFSREEVKYLPKPLYQLYMMCIGYRNTIGK
jgi:THO complex subunit 5